MRLRRFRVEFAGRGVRSSEKMVTFAENNPAWNSTKPTKNSSEIYRLSFFHMELERI